MLHGAGSNPHIVGGNRGACLLEEGRDDGPSIRTSSIARTRTRGDWRNSRRDLSFSSPLLPSRNPAFSSPKTIGVR